MEKLLFVCTCYSLFYCIDDCNITELSIPCAKEITELTLECMAMNRLNEMVDLPTLREMKMLGEKIGTIHLFNVGLFRQICTTKKIRIGGLEIVQKEDFELHDVNACLAVYDHLMMTKKKKLLERMKEYGEEVFEKFNNNKDLAPNARE